jgi:hypothetical protein
MGPAAISKTKTASPKPQAASRKPQAAAKPKPKPKTEKRNAAARPPRPQDRKGNRAPVLLGGLASARRGMTSQFLSPLDWPLAMSTAWALAIGHVDRMGWVLGSTTVNPV